MLKQHYGSSTLNNYMYTVKGVGIYGKRLLNSTWSCVFSFLKLVRPCDKLLRILMSAHNVLLLKHEALAHGLRTWNVCLASILCTDKNCLKILTAR